MDPQALLADAKCFVCLGVSEAEALELALLSQAASRFVLLEGLQLYYRFDEGSGTVASDSSGNNRTGTLVSGVQWVPGFVGPYAVKTSGVSDRVTCAPLLTGPEWTISAWTLFPVNPVIATLTRNAAGGVLGNIHVVVLGGPLGVYMSSDSSGFHSSGYDPSGLTGWHLITVVGVGGSTTFYIDGVRVGVANAQPTDAIDTIGNNVAGSSQPWGTFDDFMIWTRALSTAEVVELFNQNEH